MRPGGLANLRDKRAEPRFTCSLEVSCQPISGKGCDLWWLAEVRDFSARGIGMFSSRRFESGAFLAIQFTDLKTGQARTRTAQVTHVAPTQGGWNLGCAFRTPLEPDELAVFSGAATTR